MSDTISIVQTAPAWVPSWLEGVWTILARYPLMLSAVIVVAGLFLAVSARALIVYSGGRISAHTRTTLDDQLFRLLGGVAVVVIGYLSIVAAVQVLPLTAFATSVLNRLLVSFLILHLMRAALRGARLALLAVSEIRDRFAIVEERTMPLFDIVFTVIIVAFAAYALLQVWNIDATAWLASAGVVGIAVGFAAKDTLANLFAGFFIIADAPYKVSDYIVLDNGARGMVTRVGIRSTRVLTRDDVEIIIPNAEMANTKVVNESGGPSVKSRIRIKVGVAYGSDVDQVVALLERVALEHDAVCRDPAPRVRMRGFGDSSLDFELLCWVGHPSERGLVAHHLFMNIYKALGREGIAIPFPQRDVWLKKIPEETAGDGTE
jgi:small-conductance mechanosensitive channel